VEPATRRVGVVSDVVRSETIGIGPYGSVGIVTQFEAHAMGYGCGYESDDSQLAAIVRSKCGRAARGGESTAAAASDRRMSLPRARAPRDKHRSMPD